MPKFAEGNWPEFTKAFRDFYTSKNFKSAFELAQYSGLEDNHISRIANKPILKPTEKIIAKLAEAFAEKNKTNSEEEKREIRQFFQEWLEKKSYKKNPSSKIQSWELKLIEVEINDLSEFQNKILPDIMAKLENVGKGMIIVKYVKPGSIIIGLQSSDEYYQRIRDCYQRGELSELLGFTVSDLQIQPSLTQWFEGIFASGWQAVEELLTPQQLRPAVWSDRTKRAKLFNLRVDLISHVVILVINLTRGSENNVSVWMQVYPSGEDNYLPANLKLIVLSEGEVFEEVTARSADILMQCQFDANPGDEFRIKLALGEASVTEDFVV
ncbi:DUF1822 family protein [Argonema galeatum]|uniref:DUF1822 family protein n=1 Tax=Argonema galeatum TaxID=2942762 RepID=UPI002013112C|nr:DUF1822 family protein [Argonema galeatum]MCL1465723.1 DUF1822 family protein [Argonema galeatum A003/A1]